MSTHPSAQLIVDRLAQLGVVATGATLDSRAVRPGDLFLAFPGAQSDGRRFIADAVARGAAAVLWEQDGFQWPADLSVANLPVVDLRAVAGHLAHIVYGRPSERLALIGVTGTNGKTSISHWIAAALEVLGGRCAVIGTVGNGFVGHLSDALNTTPDAVTLHRQLAAYLAQGATATAMEVSSIGLDQGRVNGARMVTAVLTNLTRDHLEYHGTMAAYGQAKALLFSRPELRNVVLNLDDAFGREVAASLAGRCLRRIGYSLNPACVAKDVDQLILARSIVATSRGQAVQVVVGDEHLDLDLSLVGRFNIANLLAVIGTLLAEGVSLADAGRAVSGLTPPPGRMEMHGDSATPLAVVDYAHTPDALEQALTALRETAHARGGLLICLFGCGGDRDGGKRSLMGEVAQRLADAVVLTSDNPRFEDPQQIIDAIRQGAHGAQVIPDRAEAIRLTLAAAEPADVVLIAGKGHEPYQEIAGRRLPFSDAEHAAAALATYGESRP